MINGKCFSNDDVLKNKKWPEVFAEVPRPDEMVKSDAGTIAHISRVTHCTRPSSKWMGQVEPYIEVELYRKVPT